MYRPSLEEMLRGALAPWAPDVHYITNFRYPTSGGFVSYLRDFPNIADLRLNAMVIGSTQQNAAVFQLSFVRRRRQAVHFLLLNWLVNK